MVFEKLSPLHYVGPPDVVSQNTICCSESVYKLKKKKTIDFFFLELGRLQKVSVYDPCTPPLLRIGEDLLNLTKKGVEFSGSVHAVSFIFQKKINCISIKFLYSCTNSNSDDKLYNHDLE